MPASEVMTYAKEVYAACATVGFATPHVSRLKGMIDDAEMRRGDGSEAALAATAQAVQFAAVEWAQGKPRFRRQGHEPGQCR